MKYFWLATIAILLSAGAADIANATTYEDIAGQWCGDVTDYVFTLPPWRSRRTTTDRADPSIAAENEGISRQPCIVSGRCATTAAVSAVP